jgi:imidazole glycerol-phosphate synthase subunit HisH
MFKAGVISAGLGTAASVNNLMNKVGADSNLIIDAEEVSKYSHIVMPGVGSFDEGSKLIVGTAWEEAIKQHASNGKMLLGVCLGMQLLGNRSEEGVLKGLGILDFENVRLKPSVGFKVPNTGWEKVQVVSDHPITNNLLEANRFYFVHSYAVPSVTENRIAVTEHTEPFCSIIGSENIIGVQFHPEKSHQYGKVLMKNFLSMSF